ncbi:transposase [Allorhodopirellula solitaria]|uniref:Transposase IS200 like protein n=1 Tax=Allorhodopirellula solitaria TaxID=2527987 RepID=A0A5C5XRM4_9BACT|nr:transposase [Allorhodopirellula solitaria]TWT65308.1 Transposase IS200 like protein [Allorhodopirellula solitaria]
MSQSLANVTLHFVFSTKNRQPLLQPVGLRNELYAYMATILTDNVDSPAIIIGGVKDHIHALVNLSRNHAIKDVVQTMKTETSKWLKKQSTELRNFSWQAGYGVFSVSQSIVPNCKGYIAHQEAHHKKIDFQDEFRKMCKDAGIEIDERYVWD